MEEILAYLHIPFCESKCHYCAFNSYTSKDKLKEKYFNAIIAQLEFELEFFGVKKGQISSLFLGGGTPSSCDARMYEKFFASISPYLAKDCEITSEANPNSASRTWLEGMKELGINRLSFGVQGFSDAKLKHLGRTHSAFEATKTLHQAKSIGYENISIDLIYGTKFDTLSFWEEELKRALDLPIKHISAYSLSIEEGTVFYKKNFQEKQNQDLAKLTAQTLNKKGLKQYEVSNYGLACKHNLGYWQYKPYLGIGAGAVGFDGGCRHSPLSDIESYIKEPLKRTSEKLLDEDMRLEKLFLGLRSKVGFDERILSKEQKQKVQILIKENMLFYENGRYFCKDFFLADEMVLFLS